MGAISQEQQMNLLRNMCSEIIPLKFQALVPEASEWIISINQSECMQH